MEQTSACAATTLGLSQQSASRLAVLLLVGALAAFALAPLGLPDSYSWVEHGISESAAQGVAGAWVTRMGFIAFGLAVLVATDMRSRSWGPLVTMMHAIFGVSMFGVAAFSTKPWRDEMSYVEREDQLHTVFATAMGFGFIIGLVTLVIARRDRQLRAALPDLVPLAVTIIVPMLMSTSIWGVMQRSMFIVAACWYGRESLSNDDPGAQPELLDRRDRPPPRRAGSRLSGGFQRPL
jgi:hypothetical protein